MKDLTLGERGGRGIEGVLVEREKEGTGGILRVGVSGGAMEEGWDLGRDVLLLLWEAEERIPAGIVAIGLGSCFRTKEPAVRGLPLLSADGRGPNFTFGRCKLAMSRSRVEGLVDCEDFRGSAG
jgi:hypothetical protein